MGMARPRLPPKSLDSYTVKSINKTITVGDCVLMRPAENSKLPYVAKIEKIETDTRNQVKVHVRWYYRPEESIGGRRPFHGSKELFLSDHLDIQSADTIEGICVVHSFKSYIKLDAIGTEDYFSRFEYNSITGAFNPDRVAVFCKCEMPYNPDDLMVQCEDCEDWFHPDCIQMKVEELKMLDRFICHVCSDEKKVNHATSTDADTKVHPFLCSDEKKINHAASTSPDTKVHPFICSDEKKPIRAAPRKADTKVDTKRRRR
ncbi:hypothetical protein IFM89_005794 [Coptis chinensis]|uniref:Uncharacterized protein n=1 Tax=Coptis chinensis TaxID=261450 RepID=A0A835M4U8_9MAGN|nr:hypothetical protein IFM89_005794 [Coptis chinensis]